MTYVSVLFYQRFHDNLDYEKNTLIFKQKNLHDIFYTELSAFSTLKWFQTECDINNKNYTKLWDFPHKIPN